MADVPLRLRMRIDFIWIHCHDSEVNPHNSTDWGDLVQYLSSSRLYAHRQKLSCLSRVKDWRIPSVNIMRWCLCSGDTHFKRQTLQATELRKQLQQHLRICKEMWNRKCHKDCKAWQTPLMAELRWLEPCKYCGLLAAGLLTSAGLDWFTHEHFPCLTDNHQIRPACFTCEPSSLCEWFSSLAQLKWEIFLRRHHYFLLCWE